jgi:mannose-6-phosphate isomerase-like protein (cupin superfamily)
MKLVRPDSLPAKAEFSLPHGMAITGILEFRAGTRLPTTGCSIHAEDEVSFILSGALQAVSGDEHATLRTGDISFIPANEPHWAEVLEDVRIAYVLIPRV